MVKKADLAAIVRSAGGGTRYRERPEPVEARTEEEGAKIYRQPGRQSTRPITAHFPREVRDQLKILAIEQDKTLQDLIAESFNDLFAKYGKPEIAPRGKG
jgi:hypothetical protein